MADGTDVSSNYRMDGNPAGARLIRLARYTYRIVLLFVVAMLVAFIGGGLIFYQHVASLTLPPHPKADGIVVLTGGYQRIDHAVQLLSQGDGKRLLISGVNPATTGKHLRLLTRGPTNLFDCCVDIGHEAMDTEGNAQETAHWIKSHGFHSVILVTNNYHMPRSLAELRRADPTTEIIPYPVVTGLGVSDILENPLILRTLASEYVKFLLVESRDWTGIEL